MSRAPFIVKSSSNQYIYVVALSWSILATVNHKRRPFSAMLGH